MKQYKISGLSFPGEVNSLDQYLSEISKIPVLSREEEVQLTRGYRNPNISHKRQDRIFKKLATSNLRFVVRVAKKYQNTGVLLEDLVGAGNYGLLTAARKYDPERGVKFITYAVWWIRQAILKYITETGRQARIPLNRAPDINKVRRAEKRFIEEGMSEYAAREAALEETGVDTEIFQTIDGLANPIRLNDLAHKDGKKGYQMIDRFHYDSTKPTDENVEKTDLSDILRASLKTLSQREERILRLCFALDGTKDMTLEKIGERFGVTRERIRQIREKALERLKESGYGKALLELHGAS